MRPSTVGGSFGSSAHPFEDSGGADWASRPSSSHGRRLGSSGSMDFMLAPLPRAKPFVSASAAVTQPFDESSAPAQPVAGTIDRGRGVSAYRPKSNQYFGRY